MTADSPSLSFAELKTIAEYFSAQEKVIEVNSLGNGNINDTFLVKLANPHTSPFVLQRINTQVFRQPLGVMQNIQCFSQHVRDRLKIDPLDRRWEVPQIIFTQEGQNHWQSAAGAFWRAINYLDNAQTYDILHSPKQAQEVGYALGLFHSLISDLPTEQLVDTLVGFHVTPMYLAQFEQALATTQVKITPEVQYGLNFIRDRKAWASVLEDAKERGKLPLRLIHGDPKVNNVLFDRDTQLAIALIDLDTLKPGLIHYDIGDCLRSGCNPLGEETEDWQGVYFDLDLCQALLKGYLSIAKTFLTSADRAYLFEAIRLLPFELGLRFFSDYLAGNTYFKVKYPDHNLQRALVQFQLTQNIEKQESIIRSLIQDLT